MPKWTLKDLGTLQGKVIVVTGGNSGIGFDTALTCAAQGAQVVLACRNPKKAASAVVEIKKRVPQSEPTSIPLNLGNLKSVRDFARQFGESFKVLDVLVNNAGIMMPPYECTEDGFESQFGVNHLGHFALTGLLIPQLESSDSPRIVTISSLAHRFGDMDFDNIMFEGGHGYSRTRAYGRSKLANLLFTFELQRRLANQGSKIKAIAAHPGLAATNLSRYLESYRIVRFAMPLVECFIQSSEMGALPTLRAIGDVAAESGHYYGPDGFRQQRGYPRLVGSSKLARNPEVAARLWSLSENLTGIRFLGPKGPG